MTPRHYLMAGGLVVAAWLALFGDKTPNGNVAEAVMHAGTGKTASAAVAGTPYQPTRQPSTNAQKGKFKPEPVILILRGREELIGGAVYADQGGNLFSSQSWTPPPPPQPKPAAPPAPTAPPMPFSYLGKKKEEGVWEIYLAHGDNTIIAREKNVIEEKYRVEAIKPPTLTLTYLPLNQTQILTIGGTD